MTLKRAEEIASTIFYMVPIAPAVLLALYAGDGEGAGMQIVIGIVTYFCAAIMLGAPIYMVVGDALRRHLPDYRYIRHMEREIYGRALTDVPEED